jgi:amidase
MLSIRGNWPLIASADVVVPHARSVKDLLAILDVIAVSDSDTTGDFGRTNLLSICRVQKVSGHPR